MPNMIEGGSYGGVSRPNYKPKSGSIPLSGKTGIPASQSIMRPAYRASRMPSTGAPTTNGGTAPRIQSNPVGQISSTNVQTSAVAPPPTPAMPTENDWLAGDTAYQSQMAALQKALADYQAQSNQQKTQYGVDYGNKLNELGIAEKQGTRELENDFASRGLLQSGMFDNNMTELGSMFDRREGDLLRARNDFEANLATALGNFQTENNLTGQRARQEALARRAAQFGL